MVKIEIIKPCKGYIKGDVYVVKRTTANYLISLKLAYLIGDEPIKEKPKKKRK